VDRTHDMRSLVERRWQDLRDALATIPDWRTWRTCAVVYAGFLLCAAPIGIQSGLLRPGTPALSAGEMIGGSLLLFVQPALIEEILFRGLLLPRRADSMTRGRLFVLALAALALYLVSHPLNAMLFRPGVLTLFESPVYLVLTALLGVTCTATYWISRSIWPPTLLHWLTVIIWIWFLGGHALLQQPAVLALTCAPAHFIC
jgi:predicted Abi (CAAX) family protease